MKELLFTEHPDNKIEIEKSGHKYRVEQYFGTFTDNPMGSLYYFIDEKLAKTATISKPLNSYELTKELLKLIADRQENVVQRIKMTYEEVKNLIDDITWKYNGNSITNEMICKCRNKCREALEKQIPKKTICEVVGIKSEGMQGYIRYLKCPNCKRNIDEENTVDYCPNCGQAIDWSDEI